MKFSLLALLSAVAVSSATENASATIDELIVSQRRNVVFNSRRLTGECLPICVEEQPEEEPQVLTVDPPTASPSKDPTASPTKNPTASPTKNPTASPTKNPTASPTKNPTASPTKNPTPFPTEEPQVLALECPAGEIESKICVHDTDCLIHVEGDPVNAQLLNCPSCVEGQCREKPDVNGNLNCCKRTPGNDLVITNGCGANNICIGFNEHDQCEVNQHAAYCTPYCANGNVGDFVNGAWTNYDGQLTGGLTYEECQYVDGKPSNIDNDQGNQEIVKIFPLSYCLNNNNVKWKPRKASMEDFTTDPVFFGGVADISADIARVESLGSECTTEVHNECVYDIDCIDKNPEHPMWCPSCVEGVCIDNSDTNMPKGNVNCCKRTPGNSLGIATNGCGANNICWGFNVNDQCNVNQHSAYCHPGCPGGNVEWQNGVEVVTDACDYMVHADGTETGLYNDQGGNGESSGGLPKIYSLEYCNCRHVKWKSNGQFDEIPVDCPGNYGDYPKTYVEPAPEEIQVADDPTPTSFCSSGKLSVSCGRNILTCGGASATCSKQSTQGNGNVINVDGNAALSGEGYGSLCEEMIGMLEADFAGHGFGASGLPIKCNQYTQGQHTVNEEVADFACYDTAHGDIWWQWVEGETLDGWEAC